MAGFRARGYRSPRVGMSSFSPIEGFLCELRRALGWRRWVERRALTELHHHLEDNAGAHAGQTSTREEAELRAIADLGGLAQARRFVVDSNRALFLEAALRDRVLLLAGVLSLPAVLLLGLSFLTFNFPCQQLRQGGEVYEVCGMRVLQSLRAPLGGLGLFGMPQWWQWTNFISTTLGPLAAAIVLLKSQIHVDLQADEGSTSATIVVRSDRVRKLATVSALALSVVVIAYKAAG